MYEWKTLNKSCSDHKPIIITRSIKEKQSTNSNKSYKWKLTKVNWDQFRVELDNNLPEIYNDKKRTKVADNLKILNEAIITALKKTAKKVKVGGKEAKLWWNEEVQAAVTMRDNVAEREGRNSQQGEEESKNVKNLIKEGKKKSWREFIESVDSKTDTTKVWEVIKMLKEKAPNVTNKTIQYEGTLKITDKAKANAFVNHYAKVSKEKTTKEERKIKRECSNKIKELPALVTGDSQLM